MASANLDLMRSIYTARARGDFSSAEWTDPEIECVMAGGPPYPADGRGPALWQVRLGE